MKKEIKKVVMWLLGICLFFASASTSYAENSYVAPTLVVNNVEAEGGENIDISVVMYNNPGIVSMQLDVIYDSSVFTLVNKVDGGLIGSAVHSDNLMLCPYRLTWANDLSTTNYTENGTIVTLTFAVVEDAKAQSYPITVSYTPNNFEIFDCNANEVDFNIVAGNVTVREPECTHENKTAVASKSPDCINAGNNTYYVCNLCDTILKADGLTQTTVEAERLDALGHDWSEKIKDNAHLKSVGANCTEYHTYWFDCARCDSMSDTKYYSGTEVGEHVYGSEWEQGDVSGHWHKCKYCTSHDTAVAHVPGSEATEEEPQLCTVCGYVITPALGHIHKTVKVEAIKATCTEDGQKEYYICGCGAWFEDQDALQEILDKTDVVISALGHDMAVATCTEVAHCKREACDYSEGEPLGHVESEWLYNGQEHWKTCINSGCGVEMIGSREVHTDNAKCDICGYVAQAAHIHSFAFGESDELYHWNKCACGQTDSVESHMDADKDFRCDKCGSSMKIEEVKSPKTGDFTNTIALGVLAVFSIFVGFICGRELRRKDF